MATYAIGDVQGCYQELRSLLQNIQFDNARDTLWFTGDLVNRGPESLETLRFIKNLGDKHRVVLGNHDLHLLALAHKAHAGWSDDTLLPLLAADDKEELLNWLSKQPLMIYDEKLNFAMVHAGLAASWDLEKALALAKEVETIVQSDRAQDFYFNMYGNKPTMWDETLVEWDRLRCITNYFTRSRFCNPDGSLELKSKGSLESHTENLVPWFQVSQRLTQNLPIIFGHWAALGGVTNTENCFALDTGCVWGYSLTAMRLEDQQLFSMSCSAKLNLLP